MEVWEVSADLRRLRVFSHACYVSHNRFFLLFIFFGLFRLHLLNFFVF